MSSGCRGGVRICKAPPQRQDGASMSAPALMITGRARSLRMLILAQAVAENGQKLTSAKASKLRLIQKNPGT
jgi:hypothetical protein